MTSKRIPMLKEMANFLTSCTILQLGTGKCKVTVVDWLSQHIGPLSPLRRIACEQYRIKFIMESSSESAMRFTALQRKRRISSYGKSSGTPADDPLALMAQLPHPMSNHTSPIFAHLACPTPSNLQYV